MPNKFPETEPNCQPIKYLLVKLCASTFEYEMVLMSYTNSYVEEKIELYWLGKANNICDSVLSCVVSKQMEFLEMS